MRPNDAIDIHARNLPHWSQDNTLVFVTWRLADSLPQSKLQEIEETQKSFFSGHPEPWDEATLHLYRKNITKEMESFLDSGSGACVMKDPEIRQNVEAALRFFDGLRYRLHAFVVMPNHVHVLFECFSSHPLSTVLHSWKSYTAKVVNQTLGRQGTLWQDESWDRLIRNEKHYLNCVDYIHDNNPDLACILTQTENIPIRSTSTGSTPTGNTPTGSTPTGSTGFQPVHSTNRRDACSPSAPSAPSTSPSIPPSFCRGAQ